MFDLFQQLGIDWRLLLSQAVNFLVLLAVLRVFVYKPLMRLLEERRLRIEEGLAKAEEAGRRLNEVDEMAKDRLREADAGAMAMLRETEKKNKELEIILVDRMKQKEKETLEDTARLIRAKEEEAQTAFEKRNIELVKEAVARFAELSPEQIDTSLVEKAIGQARKKTHEA